MRTCKCEENMNWREFRFVKKNNTLVWRIRQDGTQYITEHGILGGKMQTFSDIPGEKGAAGTKAYVNALDNATFNMNREIRKKEECGYIEYINGIPVKEQANSISFDEYLPKSFCSYKPQTSISDSYLSKLQKLGHARYTRKYDGTSHLAVHHSWGWEIYTRRMDLASERYPHHIRALG